jgi:hypothetical protein
MHRGSILSINKWVVFQALIMASATSGASLGCHHTPPADYSGVSSQADVAVERATSVPAWSPHTQRSAVYEHGPPVACFLPAKYLQICLIIRNVDYDVGHVSHAERRQSPHAPLPSAPPPLESVRSLCRPMSQLGMRGGFPCSRIG